MLQHSLIYRVYEYCFINQSINYLSYMIYLIILSVQPKLRLEWKARSLKGSAMATARTCVIKRDYRYRSVTTVRFQKKDLTTKDTKLLPMHIAVKRILHLQ
jgi:hypothetical protein